MTQATAEESLLMRPSRRRGAVSLGIIGGLVVIVLVAAVAGYYLLAVQPSSRSTETSSSTSSRASSAAPSPSTTSTTSSSTTTSASSSTTSSSTKSSSTTTTSSAQPFAFVLTSYPNTIVVSPGSNLTYASINFIILPTAQNSGSELVNMSASSPAGISLRFVSNPVQINIGQPNSITFALAAGTAVAPGGYNVQVVGTSGPVKQSVSFAVTVVQYLVILKSNHFSPTNLTIKAGSTVYWLNLDYPSEDPHIHNVSIPSLNVLSPDIVPAPRFGVFSYTFSTPGTYPYVCTYHPGMSATIFVTSA